MQYAVEVLCVSPRHKTSILGCATLTLLTAACLSLRLMSGHTVAVAAAGKRSAAASSPVAAAGKRKAATSAAAAAAGDASSAPSTVTKKPRKRTPPTAPAGPKGSFGYALDAVVPPHTLILGTQPSDVSLGADRYYDTHTNALWHIVGDALGWRRGWLDGKGRAPPPSITRQLLHERTLGTYEEALASLTSHGYALWDVVQQSERAGSLDSDIKNAVPADVRGLVERHPTITTICLASGATTATFFKRSFGEWLSEEGTFRLQGATARKVFGSKLKGCQRDDGAIALVVMESVSPAYVPTVSYGGAALAAKRRAAYDAAGYPQLAARASAYAWKRQQWFDDCFHRELGADERAKRFGDRDGDLMDEPQPVEVD